MCDMILHVQYTTSGRGNDEIVLGEILSEQPQRIATIGGKASVSDGLATTGLAERIVCFDAQPAEHFIGGDPRSGIKLIDITGNK